MENDNLFIKQKYVPFLDKSCKTYISNNGIIKEFKLGPLSRKVIRKDVIWYNLSDIPFHLQGILKDKALTREKIKSLEVNNKRKQEFYDKDDVRVYLTDNTKLMPIVGNLLPQDDVDAYTVIEKNNKVTLKAILVGSSHWSDIFVGDSEFGFNVFCLASDLNKEQREYFKDEIIELKDALDYLENKKRVLEY